MWNHNNNSGYMPPRQSIEQNYQAAFLSQLQQNEKVVEKPKNKRNKIFRTPFSKVKSVIVPKATQDAVNEYGEKDPLGSETEVTLEVPTVAEGYDIQYEPLKINDELLLSVIKEEEGYLEAMDMPAMVLPQQCDICLEYSLSQEELATHRLTHIHDSRYTCLICYKTYSTKGALKGHIYGPHMKFKTTCTVCGKQFFNIYYLRIHMRIHTGNRPYKCYICDKRFIQSGDLTQHNRIHTGEKQYTCNICRKRYRTTTELDTHKLVHVDGQAYECDLCDAAFTRKGALYKHSRFHSDKNRHQCPVCFKRFARHGALVTHERVHDAEKAFACAVCHKAYAGKRQLIYHFYAKHNRVVMPGLDREERS